MDLHARCGRGSHSAARRVCLRLVIYVMPRLACMLHVACSPSPARQSHLRLDGDAPLALHLTRRIRARAAKGCGQANPEDQAVLHAGKNSTHARLLFTAAADGAPDGASEWLGSNSPHRELVEVWTYTYRLVTIASHHLKLVKVLVGMGGPAA